MEEHSKYKSEDNSKCRKDTIFPEYICRGFIFEKAQHLNGRDLSDSFGNVDICKVIENDKCQGTSRKNDHNDDIIHTLHHIGNSFLHVLIYSYRQDTAVLHKVCCRLMGINAVL